MVEPHLWALITAAEQAFPLLMGPSLQAVRAACPDAQQHQQQAVQTWLLKVGHSARASVTRALQHILTCRELCESELACAVFGCSPEIKPSKRAQQSRHAFCTFSGAAD